jgi:hypothetical protein
MSRRWGVRRCEACIGRRRRHWVDVRRKVEIASAGDRSLDAIAAVADLGERGWC